MTPANDNSPRPLPLPLLGPAGALALPRLGASAAGSVTIPARPAGGALCQGLSRGGYQHGAIVKARTLPASCGKDGRVSAYAAPVAPARPRFEGWA